MRQLDEPTPAMLQLAANARLVAASAGEYSGVMTPENMVIIRRCTHLTRIDARTGVTLIFSRDNTMHSSGWWKNPDYERCEHLSVSFWQFSKRWMKERPPLPQNHKLARLWCLAFFGAERCRMLWVEPPYSEHGRVADIYHYRLFMAPDWRTPILPRKEVYTREFTEAGWKSFSDIHGDQPTLLDPREQP